MTQEQKQAYEWAKNQNYNSVAARYAKLLVEVVDDLESRANRLEEELQAHNESDLAKAHDALSADWAKQKLRAEAAERDRDRLREVLDMYGDEERLAELAEADRDNRLVIFQPGYMMVSKYQPKDEDGLYIRQVTGVVSEEEYKSVMKEHNYGVY